MGPVPDIQKESDNLQILIKGLKDWQRILTDISIFIHEWPINTWKDAKKYYSTVKYKTETIMRYHYSPIWTVK